MKTWAKVEMELERKLHLWVAFQRETFHCKIIFHFYVFYFVQNEFYSLLLPTLFVILFLFPKVSYKVFIFKHIFFIWYFKYLKYLMYKSVVLFFPQNLTNDDWSHCVFGDSSWWDYVYLIDPGRGKGH